MEQKPIEYPEILPELATFYMVSENFERRSFARSNHSMFNEPLLVAGTALDEGYAEYGAVLEMREFLDKIVHEREDLRRLAGFESNQYVIERRLFRLLLDKLEIDENEFYQIPYDSQHSFDSHLSYKLYHSLYSAIPATSNPCLFPRLLKYSDDLNLVEYKKTINEL